MTRPGRPRLTPSLPTRHPYHSPDGSPRRRRSFVTVEVTGVAQREAWRANVLPEVEALGDGLWSIPVPIPLSPLRYVLVYVMEMTSGLALVDAGWNTEEAWTALGDGLRTVGGAVTDVKAVLVTHIHPDHYGLAGRIREASGAWVGLHPADAALLPGRYGAKMADAVGHMRALLDNHGVPADVVGSLSEASLGLRDFVSAVDPDRLINDGDRLDVPGWDVRAIHTPGHSPGHLCFHLPERRLLMSGDHVLPRISPNITVHAQQADNPLADFLEALERLRPLDVDEVLPAHEWRFRPLVQRLDELIEHHRTRLDETAAIVAAEANATCWDITMKMHWSRSWDELNSFMRRVAVGETLAHLVLLETEGRLRRVEGSPIRWAIL